MKYSTKLSDTIHILIFIALGDDEQPVSYTHLTLPTILLV